jgi:membrane-associated phospholipid phosphatase
MTTTTIEGRSQSKDGKREGGRPAALPAVMRGLLVVAVALGVVLGTASPGSSNAGRPPAVTPWIGLELDLIASHRLNPPRSARALALVSRSMHLAASAGGRAREDAVAGAASTVLVDLFPDEAARIDALVHETANSGSPAFARGRVVGQALVERAKSDGSSAIWTGSVPVGAGFWVATPPAFVYPPLEPLAGTWRTWNLRSGSQFRPRPPPAFAGSRFLAEMLEVYAVSRSLTEEQKRIADYWADGAGTVTPPGHWNLIAAALVGRAGWSTLRSARLHAALNTAQADAFIACWDAKYTYWTLRPVTAIRAFIDPFWLSYIVTPPFPSYLSGHSATSGAAATVLAAFFPARARQIAAMAEEAAVSRLYGGIHFRSDNDAGLELGRRVGKVAIRTYRVGRSSRDAR